VTEVGDQLRHQLASAPAVGFAVGADHPLVDAPGRLDLEVFGSGEQGLQAAGLAVGQQIGAGVQGAPGPVERVICEEPLMLLTHLLLRQRSLSIDPRAAWQRVIRDECPDGQVPYVRARVSSGTSYEGRLLHYSPSTDSEKQEIVLTRPLHARAAGGPMARIPGSWSALVLRGADITALHVRYEPIPPGNGSTEAPFALHDPATQALARRSSCPLPAMLVR
jgi:hypothetical protein